MYKNPDLSPDARAADLLSKMTVDEKIDQMVFVTEDIPTLLKDYNDGKEIPARCGIFGDISKLDDPEAFDKLQDYFLHKTRLGIPLLITFESLHGLINKKGTVFPQCAGLGGSFNPKLIYKMAKVIGQESKGAGVHQVFAPNLDIPRDPRWGRTQEAYGEDPYLVGEMGSQYVKGVQSEGVAATLKHFIAYGFPENGINLSPAHVGEREIREVMLEPFQKCIDAGAMSVMPSYNEIDGVPVHASAKYLRDILRDEMGFEGTTISDWGAIRMLHDFQFVAENWETAGKMAAESGIDIEGPFAIGYCDAFRDMVKNGDIDIKIIDEAVLRILKLKFELGLFENPYYDKQLKAQMNSLSSQELSRQMDEESILLLKNDGILPQNENKIDKVAVIGNNAKKSFLGDYISYTDSCISFYDGIAKRLGKDRVLYSRGCNTLTYTDEMIENAVQTAKQADVVMLVLGDAATRGGDVGGGEFVNNEISCSEGYDTHDLNLSVSQKKLFDEIVKLGKPTVLIVYAGRQMAIKKEVEKVNGFMFSWGGGEQSGVAFANLIFGDKSPSAKLSFSFPQSTGHIPCYYNHKMSARGSFYKNPGSPEQSGQDYVSASPESWMPFGYGLSYTKVEYSDLKADVLENGNVKVSVDVENKGNYEIDESVLLFVKMMYCPITPFVKKLRKFDKINLKPGDKKTAEFILTYEDFTYIDKNMKTVKNTGEHKIIIENLECSVNII